VRDVDVDARDGGAQTSPDTTLPFSAGLIPTGGPSAFMAAERRFSLAVRISAMNEDVLLQLSLAKQYAHHAEFAGTPRQAIADGYSAMDALFSALLTYAGQPVERNHKAKFDQARVLFPNAFTAETIQDGSSWSYSPGADWDSLSTYYREWLASRYNEFVMDPGEASCRVREAHAVISSGMRFLAKRESLEVDELEELVAKKAFGFQHSQVCAAVGEAHDFLFLEAERVGDMYGSKLGTKLAAATNDCNLDVTAGDEVTQAIILEDKDIAEEAAIVYHRFVLLIEKIQAKRLERLSRGKQVQECSPGQIVDAHNFMLSMKARYHGGIIPLVGVPWKVVKDVLSLASKTENETKPCG
jgi:hypothetical protein